MNSRLRRKAAAEKHNAQRDLQREYRRVRVEFVRHFQPGARPVILPRILSDHSMAVMRDQIDYMRRTLDGLTDQGGAQ